MANARWSSPRGCSVLTSSPRGFAKSSAVITKSIYPFPRRSPECALGSHLCERLLSEDYRVVGMDDLRTGSLENVAHLKDETHFEYIDHDVTSHINIGGKLDEIYH